MAAFFRVQNERGLGLYTTQIAKEQLYELTTRHPTPNRDSKLMEALGVDTFLNHPTFNKFCFGFTSTEQTLRWIYDREWLASLKDEGFALYEYDCPIFAGNTQAVAEQETMGQPICVHDLTTLF